MKKPSVIFLCTHNQARSQMAEAILDKLAGDYFNVFSAGFEPKEIHPLTKKVMEEKGYDMSDHYSKDLDQYLGEKHFGIVITVCQKAEKLCPTLPGVSTRLFWNIEDPAAFEGSEEERIERFRSARDELEEKIKSFLEDRDISY
ncbi:MAG: Arsenate reductase [Promethearchaeota archaeon]|jgi:arsenate reductase|nr:MAG: Arsenate reductase [Candidatus Lokiarchaeota archaeon]